MYYWSDYSTRDFVNERADLSKLQSMRLTPPIG